jgi:flagellar biosynthesis GTPase FlhF
MELKRIIARDSRAANEKAIQLYGPDVLIISSQRVDSQTELVVAIDVAPLSVAELAEQERMERQPQTASTPASAEKRTDAANFVPFSRIFEGEQAAAASSQASCDADNSDAVEPAATVQPLTRSAVPEQLAAQPVIAATAAATAPAVAASSTHEMQRSHEIVELLRQEMAALRKEFALSRQMMSWQDGLDLAPEIQQLSVNLMDAGMPTALRTLLTDSIQHLETADQALPVVQELLVHALTRAEMAMPQTGVHALCGPSGSGKTSMVARLAHAAAQAHGADQQVMISFADQRPGAWGQMQLLAAQAGVTCYRAADSAMLKVLLDDLSGKTIWIDTSGTDFAGQAEVLRSQHPQVQLHAVLPVDATVTNVQKILQNSTISWASLMLSKTDEAAAPWALIKGLSDHALPVSCMAGHSRISQSPQPFDPLKLVTLALSPIMQTVPVMPAPVIAHAPTVAMPRGSQAPAPVNAVPDQLASQQKKNRRSPVSSDSGTSGQNGARRLKASPDVLVAASQAAPASSSRAHGRAPLKVVHG